MTNADAGMICADCGVDTSFATGCGHFYTLDSGLWRRAATDGARCLCLDCVEVRLGRPVVEADFIATPPEILARLAGQPERVASKLPDERQRELDAWRAWRRRPRTYRTSGGTTAFSRKASD
jgi:hypothetical protein